MKWMLPNYTVAWEQSGDLRTYRVKHSEGFIVVVYGIVELATLKGTMQL